MVCKEDKEMSTKRIRIIHNLRYYLYMERRRHMSKYHAKKLRLDGYTFDSKAEAKRYKDLRLMEGNGDIFGLVVHPKFVLQPAFLYMGKRIRAITYTADFEYIENGERVVEDVKGGQATITQAFRIKWKIAKRLMPYIDFRIVEY